MRYSVQNPAGQSYDPADIAMLRQWAAEGRINAGTVLVREGDGAHLPAGQVPELADAWPVVQVWPPAPGCPHCSHRVPTGAALCPNCGAPAAPLRPRLSAGSKWAIGGVACGWVALVITGVAIVIVIVIVCAVLGAFQACLKGMSPH